MTRARPRTFPLLEVRQNDHYREESFVLCPSGNDASSRRGDGTNERIGTVKTITMALATLLLAFTAACGDDEPEQDASKASADSSEEGQEDEGGGMPACADVWVEGETLPEGYGGCSNDDGSIAGSSYEECTDGSRIFTHDSRFFTRGDGTIVDGGDNLLDHPEFEKLSAACTG